MANNNYSSDLNNEDQYLLSHMVYQSSQPASNSMDDPYLTPMQLGRLELYELIPFTSIFGMHLNSKNLSRAFVEYAADVQNSERSYMTNEMSSAEMDAQKKDAQYLLAELDAVMMTKPLVIAVLVAGMSQFLIGYNTGVINASYDVMFTNHSTFQWGLVVGVFALGGFLGACFAANVDTRGGAKSLTIASTLFLSGSLIQRSAFMILRFSIGRFVIGVASGLSSVLLPLYLGELAPPTLRGTLGSFTQFSFVAGILMSYLVAIPFGNAKSRDNNLFDLSVAISILQLLASLFLTDSPIWLLKNDPNSEHTQRAIKQIRGLRYGHEVDVETNLMIHASHIQCCSNAGDTLRKIVQDNKTRKLLICSLFLQVAQQFSGINAVFCYSSMIFDGLNVNALLSTSAVGGVNAVATYLALLVMENRNRKTLLLCSAGGMLVSSVSLALCMLGYLSKMLSVCFVVCYVASYAVGLGPIPWLIMVEMFEAKYVNNAMSASTQVNWVCNFAVTFSFPHILAKLGPYSFVPFIVFLLISMAFVLCLPETKGATPEELRVQIVRSLSSMFALSDDSTNGDYASSVGNLDLEWRRAMDDLRRQEAEEMICGTYNYGFQPIKHKEEEGLRHEVDGDLSDWKTRITGGLDI
ncbi:hypothetical protein ACHAWO_006059 [Cyclotella atomus]|uniref:Hexose transporter 1 n=1 Tax=Cyclotella atomus TaxID=382360 RepID=A0ABD3Q1T8_9STRA